MSRLWNPGWLPLPAAVAWVAALRVVGEGRASALIAWAAAVAIAMQMHMSAALLVPALVPFLFVGPGVFAARAWGFAALAAVACYAPHLVDEAVHGWGNSRALFEPQQTGSLGTGLLGPHAARTLAGMFGLLVAVDQENALPGLTIRSQALIRVGFVVSVLASAVILARPGARGGARWIARAGLALLVVVVAAYARARDLVVEGGESARYILVLAPAVATLVALFAASIGRLRSTVLAAALGLGITTALALQLRDADITLRGNARHITSWARVQALVADAEGAMGAPLPALAGRLAVARPDPRVGAWRVAVPLPVDYLLDRAQASFPGSLEGACAIAMASVDRRSDPAFDGSVDALSRVLGPGIHVASVLPAVSLRDGTQLWPYTVDGRCPTSLVQRYVETEEETLARVSLTHRASGRSHVLPSPWPGGRRWAVWLAPQRSHAGSGSPVLVLLDVARSETGVTVTVHSNQLRGYAYNTGVLGNAAVEKLRLVMRDATGAVVHETPLSRQRVGWTGESTPLRVDLAAWPDDTVAVSLAADLLPEAEPRVWDGVVKVRVPVEVALELRSVER